MKGLTTFATRSKACASSLLYILKLVLLSEISTQYAKTRISARYSYSNRLKSEDTENNVLLFPCPWMWHTQRHKDTETHWYNHCVSLCRHTIIVSIIVRYTKALRHTDAMIVSASIVVIYIPLQHAQIQDVWECVLEANSPLQHACPTAARIHIPLQHAYISHCNTHRLRVV